jgi:putative hydrolase of the HAD superfamily
MEDAMICICTAFSAVNGKRIKNNSQAEGKQMNKIPGIKAISFDADGTLWDFEKVMRHSLHHVLKELKKIDSNAADMLDIEKMIKIRSRVADELKSKVTNLEDIRLEAFRQTLKDIGRSNDALASHLNQVYLKHRFEDIELFNDVLPALKALRVKYTIGILSNGNSYPERCGLEGMFQFVVFSQGYGVEKPDPGLFQVAVEKAGCSTGQLLHVGDSLQNDIIGAINAGIKCVWLNRSGAKNNLHLKIDYEVSSLLELLEIL